MATTKSHRAHACRTVAAKFRGTRPAGSWPIGRWWLIVMPSSSPAAMKALSLYPLRDYVTFNRILNHDRVSHPQKRCEYRISSRVDCRRSEDPVRRGLAAIGKASRNGAGLTFPPGSKGDCSSAGSRKSAKPSPCRDPVQVRRFAGRRTMPCYPGVAWRGGRSASTGERDVSRTT